jgi:PAP2 superfamily
MKILRSFVTVASIVSLASIAQAQALPDSSASSTFSTSTLSQQPVQWYSLFEMIPHSMMNWWNVVVSKERVNDWLLVGGLTAVTFATDDATYTPAEKFYHSSDAAKRWSDNCAEIGDGRTQFALAGGFAAYGLLGNDQKALRTGFQITSAVLASGAVVQILKHATGRESPFVRTTPTGVWKILPNQVDYHQQVPHFDAYPSGHICTTIATVVVIAENYPDVKWIRPVGYAFTSIVGLGMLSNGIHWVSDYPLGLFIGYYFGMVTAHPEGFSLSQNGSPLQIHVLPSITLNGTAMNFTVQF